MTRCQCIKADKTQCTRETSVGSWCWQHQKCKQSLTKASNTQQITLSTASASAKASSSSVSTSSSPGSALASLLLSMEFILPKEPIKCNFNAGTMSFGSIKPTDKINLRTLKGCEFYLEAFNRGLDVDLSASDTDTQILKLCKQLQDQIPDLEWQRSMLYWHSQLSEDIKREIYNYTSYGYSQINNLLRDSPDHDNAILNQAIQTAPALPNDIIVYRYVRQAKHLPNQGETISLGYLSTSFLASFVVNAICESKNNSSPADNLSIMRICVPKGTQCIYIPSYEYELIFAHKIRLMVHSKMTETMICMKDCTTEKLLTNTVEATVYDVSLIQDS